MSVRRAAVWSLSAQYATFAIQFIASVIISRFFLLPADVGLFSIALAAAMLVAIFQDMGITRFITGQPQMDPDKIPNYAAVAIAIGWLVALAVALAAPAVARFYSQPELANLLWIIAASYAISPFAIIPAALLVKKLDFKSLFAVNAGSAFIGNGVAVGLAAAGFGPASLAWGLLASAIVRTAFANAFSPVLPRLPRDAAAVKPMLGFSSFSFVISASAAIGMRSQDLIVGRILGVVATGLFSRAYGLAGSLSTLVTGAISSVFYAAFAKKRDAGEELAAPYLHLVACNTALNWAAMIGLALAAEPLVLLLYGENWAGVASLLQWMAIAEMLIVAIPLQMDVPILMGRIRQLVWVNIGDTIAAVTILTIGCLIGLQEAAMSRVGYGMVWWCIYAFYIAHILGFRIASLLGIYGKSLLCALSAGAPLFIAGQYGWGGANLGFLGLFMLSGLGGLCWLAMLAIVRHPAWNEVTLALDTFARPLIARAAR